MEQEAPPRPEPIYSPHTLRLLEEYWISAPDASNECYAINHSGLALIKNIATMEEAQTTCDAINVNTRKLNKKFKDSEIRNKQIEAWDMKYGSKEVKKTINEQRKLSKFRAAQPFLTDEQIIAAVAKYNPELVVKFYSGYLLISYAGKWVALDTRQGIKQYLLDASFKNYEYICGKEGK